MTIALAIFVSLAGLVLLAGVAIFIIGVLRMWHDIASNDLRSSSCQF